MGSLDEILLPLCPFGADAAGCCIAVGAHRDAARNPRQGGCGARPGGKNAGRGSQNCRAERIANGCGAAILQCKRPYREWSLGTAAARYPTAPWLANRRAGVPGTTAVGAATPADSERPRARAQHRD